MRTKIIAEIGWNHMGDMDLAKEMIVAAKESGADYAKFQTWSVKNLKPGPWDKDGRLEIYKNVNYKLVRRTKYAQSGRGVVFSKVTSLLRFFLQKFRRSSPFI